MSSVFYRNPTHEYPTAIRGDGVYLYDSDGRQYLDGSGGAAVCSVGHGHPDVIAAVQRQVESLSYAHTAYFTNDPQEQLASRLAERFGEPGARVYFLSGGSEANETALKLVRQYWVARGEENKSLIVSRDRSYHGNTLGALSASGNLARRKLYAPYLKDWPKIDPCYAFRFQQDDESDDVYAGRAAACLQSAIDKHGAENIGAFIAETVVGATLGAVPPVPGYLAKIREICNDNDVLLILDEVMCGSGRCGTYFSFEQDGIRPDIVTIAKGLAGGYQPLGAAIVSSRIHDAIVSAHGAFEHGHTYIGHATACAAGLAVSAVLDAQNLLQNVHEQGARLKKDLEAIFTDHPNVGDIRGRGLFVGLELVADRASKKPADSSVAGRIRSSAMQNGLIIYPGSGTADGVNGAHVLLAPPFIFGPDQIDELVSKLNQSLADAGVR